MDKKRLKGYSGCGIELLPSGDVVRKTSKDKEYNRRLEAQCLKQSAFEHDALRAPAVLDMGFDSRGLFYFDMEYVDGATMAQMLAAGADLAWAVERLRYAIEPVGEAVADAAAFERKISQLKEAVGDSDQFYAELAGFLLREDWSDFPAGYCHGDLTLENIIVKDGELYLIDFLDSFCDSPMLDMAKLLQDLQCGWAYRWLDGLPPELQAGMERCRAALAAGLAPRQQQQCRQALLLHLLRIVPYSKGDARAQAFIRSAAERLMPVRKRQ